MEIKNRKPNVLLPLIIIPVLAGGILIGTKFSAPGNVGSARGLLFYNPSGNKVNHVFELITGSYVDSVSTKALEEDAIRGMLGNLDPHSQYIPATDLAAVNEPIEGNFSGIGVSFNMMNDTVVVIHPLPKGPSEKAGILPGDRIVRVNDSTVAGVKMPSADIVKMLKGKTGTKVKVSISRKGANGSIDFDITRGKIPLFSVDIAYMIAPETGYVKVNKFSKTTVREFTEAMNRLDGEGMKKLILDLRGNGGGLIKSATDMSELFLPSGKLIVYTEGKERSRADYYAGAGKALYVDTELVLLIDESSASASEIVAGAIQDNDRGTVVGRRSFGKGLVQEQYLLPDGSALRITVSRYYTPTGRCIQKPYEHNTDDEYDNELNERYAHGEMIREDSIRFNDSLRFVTPGGKTVYGGGGIMPDIFVPMDTASDSRYYRQVLRRGLVYRFAFDYTDRNRKELDSLSDYRALEKHLLQKDILKKFVLYASKQGIRQDDRDLRISGPAIENLVMACVSRNIFDDEGFYPIIHEKDKAVQRGLEILTR